MKNRVIAAALCIALLCLFSTAAYADMGPKPSVVLNLEGISDEVYYITLLSKEKSTGPHSVSDDPLDENHYLVQDHPQEDLAAWQAFRDYTDADGFYFIDYFSRNNEQNTFRWGYHPPPTFKVLIYLPQSGTFAVSEISECYAFDSCYTVKLSDDHTSLSVQKSYQYAPELLSLAARIIATVAIEILVALLFQLRKKKLLVFITVTNIVTQVILNVLLNISNYIGGSWSFVFNYIWMELLIILIEAVVYALYFKKVSTDAPIPRWTAPIYSLAANITSFVTGLWIANIIPGIF